MLNGIKRWWNRLFCKHDYRQLESFPVYDSATPYHAVVGYQTFYVCRKCGKAKSIFY